MYLELYHGRKDPDQDMTEGWGSDGPVFICTHFHCSYLGNMRLMGAEVLGEGGKHYEDDDVFLTLFEDMIYYDGVFYGDYTVFDAAESSDRLKSAEDRIVLYDREKAKLPEVYADRLRQKAKEKDAQRIRKKLDALKEAKRDLEGELKFYNKTYGVPFDDTSGEYSEVLG